MSLRSRRRSSLRRRSSNCFSERVRFNSVRSWRRRSNARFVSWRKSIWTTTCRWRRNDEREKSFTWAFWWAMTFSLLFKRDSNDKASEDRPPSNTRWSRSISRSRLSTCESKNQREMIVDIPPDRNWADERTVSQAHSVSSVMQDDWHSADDVNLSTGSRVVRCTCLDFSLCFYASVIG